MKAHRSEWRESVKWRDGTIFRNRTAGSKSKIEQFDAAVDDPRQRKPDITKAAELLEWQPKVSVAAL